MHKVSITPRGVGALGDTIQRPTEDRFLMTRQELENKMTVLLGGRAAESLIFGHLSTGAADDLAKATDIARAMVTRYGMSERLGHVVVEPEAQTFLGANQMRPADHRRTSESLAAEIDLEVRQLVQAAFDRASSILEEREQRLRLAAERLLEKETLDEPKLLELVAVDHPVRDQTISSMSRETAYEVASIQTSSRLDFSRTL